MGFGKALDAFRCRQQAEEADIGRAAFLQLVDGCNCRMSGGQHRVDHDDEAVDDVFRGLEVIFDRLQRIVITIKADMGDARGRYQIEHAFEKTIACAQDRGEDKLLAFKDRRIHWHQRGFDRHGGQFEIACHFIAEQQRYFLQQPPKAGCGRFLLAHDGELVLDKRMADDCNAHDLSTFLVIFLTLAAVCAGENAGPSAHTQFYVSLAIFKR